MLFSDFVTRVRQDVFPEGEAVHLQTMHNRWIEDALIDLQQKVPGLRTTHYDYIPALQMWWNCGASVTDAPRGWIIGVKSVLETDSCSEVDYDPVSREEFENTVADDKACGCSCYNSAMGEPCFTYSSSGTYGPGPTELYGMRYSAEAYDKPCRSTSGIYTVFDEYIWVYPRLQHDEVLIVEWKGIKRAFGNADPMGAKYDREIERAAELWLEAQVSRKEDGDMEFYATSKAEYADKVAMLVWQDRKEQKVPTSRRPPKFLNCTVYSGACGCGCGTASSATSTTLASSCSSRLAGHGPPGVPTTATVGSSYYDLDTGIIWWWDGTAWSY